MQELVFGEADANGNREVIGTNPILLIEQLYAGIGRDSNLLLDLTEATTESETLYNYYLLLQSDPTTTEPMPEGFEGYKEIVDRYKQANSLPYAEELNYYDLSQVARLYNTSKQLKQLTISIDTLLSAKVNGFGEHKDKYTAENITLSDGNTYNIAFAGWYLSNRANTNITKDFENMQLLSKDAQSDITAVTSDLLLCAVFRTYTRYSFTYNPTDVQLSFGATTDSLGDPVQYLANEDGTITIAGNFFTGEKIDITVSPKSGKAYTLVADGYYTGADINKPDPEEGAEPEEGAVYFNTNSKANVIQSLTIEKQTKFDATTNYVATRTISTTVSACATEIKEEYASKNARGTNNDFVLKCEDAILVAFKTNDAVYGVGNSNAEGGQTPQSQFKYTLSIFFPTEETAKTIVIDGKGNATGDITTDGLGQPIQVIFNPTYNDLNPGEIIGGDVIVYGYFKPDTEIAFKAESVNGLNSTLDGWYMYGNTTEREDTDENGFTHMSINGKSPDNGYLAISFYDKGATSLKLNLVIADGEYEQSSAVDLNAGDKSIADYNSTSNEYMGRLYKLQQAIEQYHNGIYLNYGNNGIRYIDQTPTTDPGNNLILKRDNGYFVDVTEGEVLFYPTYYFGSKSEMTLSTPEYITTDEGRIYKFVGYYTKSGQISKLKSNQSTYTSGTLLTGEIDIVYEELMPNNIQSEFYTFDTNDEFNKSEELTPLVYTEVTALNDIYSDYLYNRLPIGSSSVLEPVSDSSYTLFEYCFKKQDGTTETYTPSAINSNGTSKNEWRYNN